MENNDKASKTVKKLITEYQLKSLRNKIGAPIKTVTGPEDNLIKPAAAQGSSLVQMHLYNLGPDRFNQPYVWQELIAGLHKMPIAAWEAVQAKKPAISFNTAIAWSCPEAMRLKEVLPLIGAAAIREKNSLDGKRANRPLTAAQTMLLLCYQAKPRPVAWAMQGLSVIDMLAWMYQDVIAMDLDLGRRLDDFNNNLPAYRDWLKQTPPRAGNTPLRHFRVRLAACLGINATTVERVIHDQSDYTLPILLQKLMERDDDEFYSLGVLRHYKEVRDDFNALSEYAIRCQYGIDSVEDRRINQVQCPSLYEKHEFKKLSLRVSHK